MKTGHVRLLLIAALASVAACHDKSEYSAYVNAGGAQCGNNHCQPGDLCVDPAYQNYAGLCRAVKH